MRDTKQYIITFKSGSYNTDTRAIHDMLEMIITWDGHVDCIIESDRDETSSRWTVVYTCDVDLQECCPKSCDILYH